jgi:sugar lactone lactonase YvrE
MAVPDRAASPNAPSLSLASSAADLANATGRLLLLFNVAGDPSPLHALDGDAMLDAVTAALLVVGLGLAIGAGRSRALVLPAWLVVALGFALVTGRGQPPDALAAIHALTPALLLAASAITVTPIRQRHLGSMALPVDLALVLLAAAIGINGHALYVRRPADTTTWSAYGGAEALAARQINALIATHTIYLADAWIDHPTLRFLVPGLTAPRRIDPSTTFPLSRDESFAYFGPGDQEIVAEDLERLYEDGEIDRYRSPLDEEVVVARSFRASAKVVAATRGVTLRSTVTDRSRTNRVTLPEYALSWPTPGESAQAATLELFSSVSVEEQGEYRLRLDGPPHATLEVNGVKVAESGQEATVRLAIGSQRVRVNAVVDSPARIEVTWAPPGSSALVPIPRDRLQREARAASGLLALYRSGTDPAAPPELARVERWLERDGLPPPIARPYVVDWVGTIDAPRTGTYQFQLTASGPASLWIDHRPVVSGDGSRTDPVSVVLEDGDHPIQIRFLDADGPTRLDLHWLPPGEGIEAVPTSRLRTPDAPVGAAPTLPAGLDATFTPLGAPRVRWLASTEGEPRAVAVDADGDVLLTNVGAREIQRVVDGGRSVASLPAGLSVPADIEVGTDGAVWALDALLGHLVRLDEAGAIVRTLDNRDVGLYRPRGLGVDPDGSVLIADTGGSRIVRVAPDGTELASIGPDVGGPERIKQPTDVAVGPEGQLFVVNGEGGAVLRLSKDGRYERHWTVLPADTERGAHLAIGPDRSLWVSEPEGRRVSRFTFDGMPSGVVDQTRAGRLLRLPVGIAVGADGMLYVADASLRAIVAFSFRP